jgi:diadenosine tetraphosphate (Ap4A) HIT family hydrolase
MDSKEDSTGESINNDYVQKEGNIKNNKRFNNISNKNNSKLGPKKNYTTRPLGTIKEHLINESDNYNFYHDLWQRAMIIVAPKGNYSTVYDVPSDLIGNLFQEINNFVNFWNIKNYVLMFNNGQYQKSNQFHVKIKINEGMANRMRRDHFARIKMQREYEPANQNGEEPQVPQNPYKDKNSFKAMLEKEPEGVPSEGMVGNAGGVENDDLSMVSLVQNGNAN